MESAFVVSALRERRATKFESPAKPMPSPHASPQSATSGRTGDAPTVFLVAAVTAALVVILLAAVLVLRDLRAQGG